MIYRQPFWMVYSLKTQCGQCIRNISQAETRSGLPFIATRFSTQDHTHSHPLQEEEAPAPIVHKHRQYRIGATELGYCEIQTVTWCFGNRAFACPICALVRGDGATL